MDFKDYIKYGLIDKIPIECLNAKGRKIVEKFAVEKLKTLDRELCRESVYVYVNFDELLTSIDPSVDDLNKILYEAIKDQIPPFKYPSKMKKLYSDRLFKISDDSSEELRNEMTDFNNGYTLLEKMVHNWDLYKDKYLSYCKLLNFFETIMNYLTSKNMQKVLKPSKIKE